MGRWTANSTNINFITSDSQVFKNADLGFRLFEDFMMKVISWTLGIEKIFYVTYRRLRQ